MKQKIWKRFASAALVAGLCLSHAEAASFSDVSPNAWYYNAVETCHSYGYMNGDPEGTFRPSDSMTRAECAAMLLRIADANNTDWYSEGYQDVAQTAWYAPAVSQVGAAIGGSIYRDVSNAKYPNIWFSPRQPCTREDFAVGFYNIMGWYTTSWKYRFSDLNDISWGDAAHNYRQAACAMANNEIMIGDEQDHFNPKQPLTRAEMAQVMLNYMTVCHILP